MWENTTHTRNQINLGLYHLNMCEISLRCVKFFLVSYLTVVASFFPIPTRTITRKLKSELFLSSSENDNEAEPYYPAEPRWFRRRGLNVDPQTGIIGSVILTQNSNNSEVPLTDGSEIRSLAIFPFDDGCVFPTGMFPLNIFVMKFRQLVNDAYDQKDKMFGVVCSDGAGGLCEVGTAVQIVERNLQPDGSQILFTVCRSRFKIRKILQEEPYMICEVEYNIVDKDVAAASSGSGEFPQFLCDLEKEVFQLLRDVITLTSKLSKGDSNNNEKESNSNNNDNNRNSYNNNDDDGVIGDELQAIEITKTIRDLSPQSHPFRTQVASDFSFAICDFLGSLPKVRQLLLESSTLEARLKILRNILVGARSYLFDQLKERELEAFG